ncbi:hypothetical protein CYMTET_20339 [Cymbomonas tetramitiformis]|uniref:Amine oxidase domain-containing protein n=1 Tax=Cymbomonas tetramitiformis TaxID=36881 RepID=A0AAE0G491_9CHLO|nr:hypothetical protein CYMTET_20339 [Cymbomonas tetramitiformis]
MPPPDVNKFDVIVIGLGIGGLQLVNLLLDQTEMRICAFESAESVGGLVVTKSFAEGEGHNMGPSYHLKEHVNLEQLLNKFDSNCTCFPESSPESAFFYSALRKENTQAHANKYIHAMRVLDDIKERSEYLSKGATEENLKVLQKALPWYDEIVDFEINYFDSESDKCVCGDYQKELIDPLFQKIKKKDKRVSIYLKNKVKFINKFENDWLVQINDVSTQYACTHLVVAAPVPALGQIKLLTDVPEDVKEHVGYLSKTITPKASMRVFVRIQNKNLVAKVCNAVKALLTNHNKYYMHLLTTLEGNKSLSPLWSMIFMPEEGCEYYDFLLAYCDSDAADFLHTKYQRDNNIFDNLLRSALEKSLGITANELPAEIDAQYINFYSSNAYHVWERETDLNSHNRETARMAKKHRIHFVGEAYSENYRTWIEGALVTAKAAADILQKHKITNSP